MKIRLLNLDRSPDRLAEFVARNPHMEMHYSRVAAIDGALADTQRLIANDVILPDLKYTKGALGAALSHMVQWRDAIQSDTALTILEDDVVLAGNFVEETERLISLLPEDWEYISWGWGFDALMTFQMMPGYSDCTSSFDQDSLRKSSQHFSTEQVDSRLFRIKAGFGTIGYSISPRGARRFLNFCMPLRSMSLQYPGYPEPLPNTGIDNMMAQLYPNMGAYVAVPPLVVTNNYHATSTVQTYHVESSMISTVAPPKASGDTSESVENEPLAEKVIESLDKQNLPSTTKCTEFVLVSRHRTILTADAERGRLQHSSVDKSSLNLCLTLADGVAQSVEEIAFEVLGEELVLQRVGDAWVLHQNGNFAILRVDGSVAFERQAENDSLLYLISAESVRLISPSAEQVVHSKSSTRRRLMLIVPHLVVGGADKVNLDLVTELKADFEITLVATQEGGQWMPRFEAQAERLVLLGQLMPPELQPVALAFLLLRLEIDCVMVSNSQDGYQSLPFLRQHFPNLPIFDLLHGQGGKLDGGGFPKFSMVFDQYLTGRIMITDYLRELMISNYGLAPHRITRIYNGVNLHHFAPITQEQSMPPIVSYIGRLAREKHPEHVLAIARELNPTVSCRFKIAGDGPLHAALTELLAGDPPCHPVEISGYVDNVRELLADTYVLLLTSEMEGLPIVVLEAMAMGVPVICSAVGGLPEMIRDGVDGFLVPYGSNFAADAANRVELLLADPNRKARMGRSARERAEALFDIRAMMDSYRALLTNAIVPRLATMLDTPSGNSIERGFGGNFYVQKLKVRDVPYRLQYLKTLVAGRRVLHVGCTDYPVFDSANNLHIQLNNDCAMLDGLDTDHEGIKILSQYVPGRYFTQASEVSEQYDVLLVPETIEHVHNIREFLTELDTIDFAEVVITAPCLIGWNNNFSYTDRAGRLSPLLAAPQDYIEEIHPDHKAWFTPYTLANCVEQFTSWSIKEILFLDNKRMTAVRCSKTALRAVKPLDEDSGRVNREVALT